MWGRSLTPNEVTELYQRGQASLALNADLAAAGKAFVSLNTSDPTLGKTSGTSLFNIGDIAQVIAVPESGSLFVRWSGPFTNRPADFDHTVTASVEVTATFAKDNADDDGDGLTNYEELAVYFTQPKAVANVIDRAAREADGTIRP